MLAEELQVLSASVAQLELPSAQVAQVHLVCAHLVRMVQDERRTLDVLCLPCNRRRSWMLQPRAACSESC